MSNKLLESYDSILGSGKPVTRDFKSYRTPNGSMPNSNPKFQAYRQQIVGGGDRFREECAKHILLDIYVKALPFDDGYCDGNRGVMANDINTFLADKKTTGLQYLKDAHEATKAPLLEFVIRSIDNIGSEYTESAILKLKEDTDAGMDVPPVEAPTDMNDIDNQIIDVKKDLEYEDFLEKLKKKTVSKIVADITELLKDKKDENDMSFNLQQESTGNKKDPFLKYPENMRPVPKPEGLKGWKELLDFGNESDRRSAMRRKYDSDKAMKTESSPFMVAMNYMTEWTMKNELEIGTQDDMIGLAIRESTLNMFDVMFRQRGSSINEYTSKVRLGNGILINEKTLVSIMEPAQSKRLSVYEEEEAKKLFGNYKCIIMKCKDGYYAKTQRARTTCYSSLDKIPKSKIDYVSTTA